MAEHKNYGYQSFITLKKSFETRGNFENPGAN